MKASAVVFDNSDTDYQAWLSANPTGFVLNARRSLVPSYMVLHRASCPSISQYTRMKTEPRILISREQSSLVSSWTEHLYPRHGQQNLWETEVAHDYSFLSRRRM